jgi:hypothetical protein
MWSNISFIAEEAAMSRTDRDSLPGEFCFNKEFSRLSFGDLRLKRRFIGMIQRFSMNPSLPIRSACESWSESMGAYRLFDNDQVEYEEILSAHRAQVIERIRPNKLVLCVQDTTGFSFGSHLATEGLGSISQGKFGNRGKGIFAHSSLAINSDGTPLGVIDQIIWSRAELTLEDELFFSERNRWTRLLHRTKEIATACPEVRLVNVCDREADFNNFVHTARSLSLDFLFRSKTNRIDKQSRSIVEALRNQSLGEFVLNLPRRSARAGTKNGKAKEAVPERTVKVRVSAGSFQLKGLEVSEILNVNAVLVEEQGGAKDPLCWLLLTSLEVATYERALEVIDLYKKRWEIETFHKIMKSGYQIERCLLNSVDKLKKFIATMSVVAWRLHHLAQAARQSPHLPALTLLRPVELQALYVKINKKKITSQALAKITLAETVTWIAQMGGYLARKKDPPPGPLVLWRGWAALMDFAMGFEAALSMMQQRSV